MTDDDANKSRGFAQAGRNRAEADGGPFAQVVDCGIQWDIGAPLPTILQWEHETHLFFNLLDGGVGRIIFEDCRASTFGPPGEEGHALDGRGWEPYRALRVVRSPWLTRMVGATTELSHFVLPFHDTTFECIAHAVSSERMPGTMIEALRATIDGWE